MAISRMQARRRLDQLNTWCALVLTAWFMGFAIGAAQAAGGM